MIHKYSACVIKMFLWQIKKNSVHQIATKYVYDDFSVTSRPPTYFVAPHVISRRFEPLNRIKDKATQFTVYVLGNNNEQLACLQNYILGGRWSNKSEEITGI